MPRFESLQAAVGQDVRVRIMTYEYDTPEPLRDPRVDLVLGYDSEGARAEDRRVIAQEAVVPVAAPHYAAAVRDVLGRGVRAWGGLTLLRLTKPNLGWATWDDWFQRMGAPERAPHSLGFENYLYLLEAAAAGRGIALGWRGLIERYLEAGSLVPLSEGYAEFDRPFYAVLAARARDRPVARACLAFLAESPDDRT